MAIFICIVYQRDGHIVNYIHQTDCGYPSTFLVIPQESLAIVILSEKSKQLIDLLLFDSISHKKCFPSILIIFLTIKNFFATSSNYML